MSSETISSPKPKECIKKPEFKNWITFDFGPLEHPEHGHFHINSKFPRHQATYWREFIPKEDNERLMAEQTEWVNRYWKTEGKEVEYARVIDGCTLWAIYTNPFSPLFSKHMELYLHHTLWVFYVDDEMEISIRNKISPDELGSFCDQSLDILRGKYDYPGGRKAYKDIPSAPNFKGLWECLWDVHQDCLKYVKNYMKNNEGLIDSTLRYFDVFMWCCYDQPDKKYSSRAFRYWRGIDSANEVCVEFVAVLREICVPPRIRKHPCFQVVEHHPGMGGWTNDVLGIRKTCFEPDLNSLTGYYLSNGVERMEDAIEMVCENIGEEISDYLLMKDVLLKQFDYEKNLVDWLDTLEANVDGYWPVYMRSIRYYAVAGCIQKI